MQARRRAPLKSLLSIYKKTTTTVPVVADCGAASMDDTNKQQVIVMNKLMALILLVAIGALSGCNTIEGAGKDIQSGGEAVSDTARDVKKEM